MKVTPLDGLDRFHVQSAHNPDQEYLVDLSENKGIGKCSCLHHHYRIQPMIDARLNTDDPDRLRCQHVIEARKYLGKELVDTVTKPKAK